jgi:hypothetical protein
MSSRNRGRGDPLGSTDALLNAADTFAARPAEEVMDELGLTREKAEQWQRICAELAQTVRAELAAGNSRPRAIRSRRNVTSTAAGPAAANGGTNAGTNGGTNAGINGGTNSGIGGSGIGGGGLGVGGSAERRSDVGAGQPARHCRRAAPT